LTKPELRENPVIVLRRLQKALIADVRAGTRRPHTGRDVKKLISRKSRDPGENAASTDPSWLTARLARQIDFVVSQARLLPRSTDRQLPPDAAAAIWKVVLQVAPILEVIERGRSMVNEVSREPLFVVLSRHTLSELHVVKEKLYDLMKLLQTSGPAVAEIAEAFYALERAENEVRSWLSSPFLRSGRGRPSDTWASSFLEILATFWLAQGWKPTTVDAGAYVSVAKCVLSARRPDRPVRSLGFKQLEKAISAARGRRQTDRKRREDSK